jgi:hypothetical protein
VRSLPNVFPCQPDREERTPDSVAGPGAGPPSTELLGLMAEHRGAPAPAGEDPTDAQHDTEHDPGFDPVPALR